MLAPELDTLFRDLSMPTNDSDCQKRDSYSKLNIRDIKSQEPQLWTSSVRSSSVFGSLQEGQSSAYTLWKETESGEGSPYEDKAKSPVRNDTDMKSEGFGCSPPEAPITVLTRNVKGVWTKFKATAGEEVWLTPQLGPQSRTPTEVSDADRALHQSRPFVQQLLQELIASLPLLPSDANDVKKPKAGGPVKRNRHTSSTRSLSSPPPRRSLCVQTHTFNEDSCCESRPTKQRAKGADEQGWAGGVRALRDAHVRLVLRQLRHVERLNRALDRRARGSPCLDAQ